jgi:hypothetical protein
MIDDDVERMFTYHKPFGTQLRRYQELREKAKELAYLMVESCPAGDELDVALTRLSEASMWANAAIARNETEIREAFPLTGGEGAT